MFGFLLVLLLFSVGFTLSVGLFSYVIFGEPTLALIGALMNASITGILLLIIEIKITIICIDCFINDNLRK